MSRRIHPIVVGEIYHVFNRSVAGQPIFSSIRDYQRLLNVINYYHFSSPDLRFSYYNRLPTKDKQVFLTEMNLSKNPLVEIYAFCLMPNHYHLLAKELQINGLRKFIGNLQNSYAKFINKKMKRNGSLFQEMFKTVHIENDEQFVHVARYIHLNPLTSCIVNNFEKLIDYPWFSLPIYLKKRNSDFLKTDLLSGFYKNTQELMNFTLDQADYQKKIHDLEYLTLENIINCSGGVYVYHSGGE